VTNVIREEETSFCVHWIKVTDNVIATNHGKGPGAKAFELYDTLFPIDLTALILEKEGLVWTRLVLIRRC
jgi:alanyl-tRNA synthetase